MIVMKLSRFAGVSEADAEREPAGEIPSAARDLLVSRLTSMRVLL
jgi:hypothetical protein